MICAPPANAARNAASRSPGGGEAGRQGRRLLEGMHAHPNSCPRYPMKPVARNHRLRKWAQRAGRAAVALSLVVCAAAAVLRFRARQVGDTWKVSAAGRCLLVHTNWQRYFEVRYVPRGWNDRGAAWWSVDRRRFVRDVGPAILDYNYNRRETMRLEPLPGQLVYSTGSLRDARTRRQAVV